MALIPIFRGHVGEDARLGLLEDERDRRRVYLQTLAGKDVEIIIRKVRKQRSRNQNSYIHAVPIPILAEHFGETIPDMKLILMGECWGWRFDKLAGREIPIKAHTSDMSDEECSYFIDWVIPWAMVNHGVAIPLPNEVAA